MVYPVKPDSQRRLTAIALYVALISIQDALPPDKANDIALEEVALDALGNRPLSEDMLAVTTARRVLERFALEDAYLMAAGMVERNLVARIVVYGAAHALAYAHGQPSDGTGERLRLLRATLDLSERDCGFAFTRMIY